MISPNRLTTQPTRLTTTLVKAGSSNTKIKRTISKAARLSSRNLRQRWQRKKTLSDYGDTKAAVTLRRQLNSRMDSSESMRQSEVIIAQHGVDKLPRKYDFNPVRSLSDLSHHRSRRICQWHHQLKAEKEALVERKKRRIMEQLRNSPIPPVRMRNKKSELKINAIHRLSTTSNGPSRARVGISNLSVPLAWNSDEHFGTRGEGRMYSMFVVLQTKSNVIDSRIVTAIDRTCTDVNFTDSFIFENQTTEFEVEVCLYSARTDNRGDINQSLKQKLTRSLGRKLGAAYKLNLPNEDAIIDPTVVCPDTTSNSCFRLLGRTILTLKDAKPKIGIYDIRLSPSAESNGPPLYGHICCRLVAQPNSVVMPLSNGILTVRPLDEDRIYQNVRCRLQSGILRCSVPDENRGSERAILHIYFSKDSKVMSSDYPRSIIVTSDRYFSSGRRDKEYLITAESEEDIAAWRHAFNLQIFDCEKWGEFAVSSVKLTSDHSKPEIPSLCRASGRRLYDEIQVDGTVSSYSMSGSFDTCSPHRNLPEPSTVISFSPHSKYNQTAPSGRRRGGRAPVQTLFQPAAEGEPRYIIKLAVGDVKEACEANTSSYMENNYYDSGYEAVQQVSLEKRRQREHQHSESSDSQDSGRFRGLKKSWQRSFGALLNRKHAEVSRF